ncbi:hypothetical protein HPP92_027206 [Vanilla planifolia]|uniref:Uncharacterized protein n=1 Tax=Vanilla planifolia TaxID=51239 RepID=A0A835P9N9_VANPL|nr:hypothetical protein HPP92_027206 [Vanilla planifolia]
MANLSSLIHDLRERIAASSSTSVLTPTRFPAKTCSRRANEREVTAVLKLLSHTARNFPGVFHGKAAAVLPVLGRILPFLAEPAFRSRHELIFDTAATLLALLRTGERDAYRQFFLDAMVAVEE